MKLKPGQQICSCPREIVVYRDGCQCGGVQIVEKRPSVISEISDLLATEMRNNEDYAQTWYNNILRIMVMEGCPQDVAERAACRYMETMFRWENVQGITVPISGMVYCWKVGRFYQLSRTAHGPGSTNSEPIMFNPSSDLIPFLPVIPTKMLFHEELWGKAKELPSYNKKMWTNLQRLLGL